MTLELSKTREKRLKVWLAVIVSSFRQPTVLWIMELVLLWDSAMGRENLFLMMETPRNSESLAIVVRTVWARPARRVSYTSKCL